MLRHILAPVLLAIMLILSGPVLAVQPDEVLDNATLEARARALSTELRCLVCQNQSIDDSNAPLARDLRLLVRERLKTGESDAQIMSFIVARYGEFVLLRPPFDIRTLLLWLTPFMVLVAGGLAVAIRARAKEKKAPLPLSEAERQALASAIETSERRN